MSVLLVVLEERFQSGGRGNRLWQLRAGVQGHPGPTIPYHTNIPYCKTILVKPYHTIPYCHTILQGHPGTTIPYHTTIPSWYNPRATTYCCRQPGHLSRHPPKTPLEGNPYLHMASTDEFATECQGKQHSEVIQTYACTHNVMENKYSYSMKI